MGRLDYFTDSLVHQNEQIFIQVIVHLCGINVTILTANFLKDPPYASLIISQIKKP